MTTSAAITIAVGSSGAFFVTALVCGIWKYRFMIRPPDHRAPFYVDTAHRASLLYSFACLVLAKFAEDSPLPPVVSALAVAAPVIGFASAIVTYVSLGLRDETDNQFRRRTFTTTWGMFLLILLELGGFLVLFGGWASAQLR